jgi:hypothetical protein
MDSASLHPFRKCSRKCSTTGEVTDRRVGHRSPYSSERTSLLCVGPLTCSHAQMARAPYRRPEPDTRLGSVASLGYSSPHALMACSQLIAIVGITSHGKIDPAKFGVVLTYALSATTSKCFLGSDPAYRRLRGALSRDPPSCSRTEEASALFLSEAQIRRSAVVYGRCTDPTALTRLIPLLAYCEQEMVCPLQTPLD